MAGARKPATNGRRYDGGKRGSGGSYRSFDDKASGGFMFHGDGKAQDEFFARHSNAPELAEEIVGDVGKKSAFVSWTSGAFMSGQQYDGWDNMKYSQKRKTQEYDDILDRATLSEGVVVRRLSDAQLVLGAGNKTPSLSGLQAMKGRTITARGNMSTSAAGQGLTIGGNKNIEYEIKIPKGSTGAGMWIGDDRFNGWGNRQREFMTNRDTVYRVGDTRYDASRKVYVTELTFMGREPHDYGKSGRV